jgi:hypothetical protein
MQAHPHLMSPAKPLPAYLKGMQARLQAVLQFGQMFRTRFIAGAERKKRAPMALTIAETP